MSARRTSARPIGLLVGLCAVGLAIVSYALVVEPRVGWAALLVAAVFGVTIAIGGALFAAIHVATGARWWRPLRGASMDVARTLIVPALALAIVLALGTKTLYPWAHGGEHISHSKAAWLNPPFFWARSIGIMLVWFAFVSALRSHIHAEGSRGLVRRGIAFLVAFAVTISVAFWDWTMSLEPEWFSTMYGVYGFAGSLQAGIAAIALVSLYRGGRDQPVHELGTVLFSFSLFWGYIWYSQGMLIWYANLPEETMHYAHRLTGGWTMWFWLNPIINLVIPIVALMSRHAKKSRLVVGQVALVIVVGHFLDVLLLVGPAVSTTSLLPLSALGAALAVVALMLLVFARSRHVATAPPFGSVAETNP